jgi:hypothetical protein
MICAGCKRDLPIENFAKVKSKRRSRRCSGCKRRATTSIKRWHTKGRECTRCGLTVPCPEQITDYPWREIAICKPCISAKANARTAEWARWKRANDEEWANRQRAAALRWQARNPEMVRANNQRRYVRIKADAVRHEQLKGDQRMRHRLRQEKLGRPSKPLTAQTYVARYGSGVSRVKVVPVGPLLPMLREAVETVGKGVVADIAGVPERRLYEYLHRREANLSIISADKLCVYFGTPFSLLYGEHT